MVGRVLLGVLFVVCLLVIVVSAANGSIKGVAAVPILAAAIVGRLIGQRRGQRRRATP